MEFVKPGININFVGKRRYAYAVSLLLILATVISLIIHGGPNYGVDFAGGTLVQVQFQEPTTAQDIRQGLSGTALAGATIQRFGDKDANEFLIGDQGTEQELEGISEEFRAGWQASTARVKWKSAGWRCGGQGRPGLARRALSPSSTPS
jgi:preprotein translocase subunit SecF